MYVHGVSWARDTIRPEQLIIGGRSLKGLTALPLADDKLRCDSLIPLAYPLHPAGKPNMLRDTRLAQIQVPVLCLNGTCDSLCRRNLMKTVFINLFG